jgi:hypothetical protein
VDDAQKRIQVIADALRERGLRPGSEVPSPRGYRAWEIEVSHYGLVTVYESGEVLVTGRNAKTIERALTESGITRYADVETRASRRREAGDRDVADDLLLFLDNESDLYQQKKSIAANLLKKLEKGRYERERAKDAWMYVVERAAKKYADEQGRARDWARIFVPATRDMVASELESRWLENAKAGRPDEV